MHQNLWEIATAFTSMKFTVAQDYINFKIIFSINTLTTSPSDLAGFIMKSLVILV